MKGPVVSIVLPTFNGSRFLQRSIESCLRQHFEAWELIVVDDASTDCTPDILAHYAAADPRIRVIRHQRNLKLPAALNSGFALAAGRYLTWTSDDNFYAPEALDTLVAALEQDSAIAFVYSDYLLVDEADRELRSVSVQVPELLWQGNHIGPCFLYRREVMELVGSYNSELFLVEDYDYWLRVSQHFAMKPLHAPLYHYRTHDGSLSAANRRRIGLATMAVLERHLPGLPWLDKRDRARAYLSLYQIARSLARWKPSNARYKLRALRHDPVYVAAQGMLFWWGVASSTWGKVMRGKRGKTDGKGPGTRAGNESEQR